MASSQTKQWPKKEPHDNWVKNNSWNRAKTTPRTRITCPGSSGGQSASGGADCGAIPAPVADPELKRPAGEDWVESCPRPPPSGSSAVGCCSKPGSVGCLVAGIVRARRGPGGGRPIKRPTGDVGEGPGGAAGSLRDLPKTRKSLGGECTPGRGQSVPRGPRKGQERAWEGNKPL